MNDNPNMEQKGTPKKKVQARSHYAEEQIAKVLVATDGFICATAQTLKINRRSVYKYLKRYPALEDVLADARENSLDIAESRLMKAIRADKLTAIIFFLKTQGKSRGYVEKQEHALAGLGQTDEPFKFTLKINGKLHENGGASEELQDCQGSQ